MVPTLAVFIWVADSLTRLSPDAAPPEDLPNRIELTCARNEYEPAQIAVRAAKALDRLTCRASDLKRTEGDGVIPAANVQCNFVGFISIEHNTYYTPDDELICKAPAEVPDVLLPDETISLPADRTQSIWVTVYVPAETPAGAYAGAITVDADGQVTEVPVHVTVYDFAVPEERHLYVTNWFGNSQIAQSANTEFGTDDFYRMLRVYAENMAAHRQNVFWLPWSLIKVTRQADGKLAFDYGQFDRYIETFLEAGVDGRIEIQFTAHHGEGGWSSPDIILNNVSATDQATGQTISLPPDEGLGPLLEDLERHLDARGWLDRAMMHVCDEPQLGNVASFKKAAAFLHQHAPRIKRIEAIEARDFYDALEVWVPKLSHLRNWYDFYDQARKDGNELWYYICCHPTGRYPNRFLDYALVKVRLLHWLNYRYGLTGYLHWGFNHWKGDPFAAPPAGLPPGDRNIVYPGPEGDRFSLLSSIRWEVQRDSLEDFEYLWLLEQRHQEVAQQLGEAARQFDPAARSRQLCRTLIHDFTDYERDPARLRAVRDAAAREIELALQEPLVLWETAPSTDMYVEPGPTAIEVSGVTRPGACVVLNGKEVAPAEDGTFTLRTQFWNDRHTITLRVETDKGSKELARNFAARGAA